MIYSKPLYGILGVYLPLSILILWSPLPGLLYWHLASSPSPSVTFNEALWCAAGFLSAVTASVYAVLIKRTMMRHSAADFRGCIVVTAAAYLFMSLLRRDLPLPQRFLPSVNSVAAALAALFAWFSVIFIRETFSGLELFGSFTTSRRGEQLREIMREFSPEMSQTNQGLKSLMVSYGVQFIPPCLLLSIPQFAGNSPFLKIFVFFVFCCGFLILGFFGLQRRELSYASEGVSLTIRDRVLPIPVMALGIGLAALLAVAGSSDASLFPPEIILVLLAWLGNLLRFFFRPRDQMDFPMPRGAVSRPDFFEAMLPDEGEAVPWAGWKYIRYGFIVLLALLFLLFMIHPLLRRTGFSVRAGKILAALTRWLGDLKRGFFAFFTAFRDRGQAVRIPDPEKLRHIASQLLSAGVKRKDTRSVNLFARLVLWGIESLAVPWKPSLAPGEYCGLLDTALLSLAASGEVREGVIRAGELFEKALYSPRRLSGAEEKEFRLLVEKITGDWQIR